MTSTSPPRQRHLEEAVETLKTLLATAVDSDTSTPEYGALEELLSLLGITFEQASNALNTGVFAIAKWDSIDHDLRLRQVWVRNQLDLMGLAPVNVPLT